MYDIQSFYLVKFVHGFFLKKKNAQFIFGRLPSSLNSMMAVLEA